MKAAGVLTIIFPEIGIAIEGYIENIRSVAAMLANVLLAVMP